MNCIILSRVGFFFVVFFFFFFVLLGPPIDRSLASIDWFDGWIVRTSDARIGARREGRG